MIPYGKQSIDQADVDAVVEVLRSDFLTQGPAVPLFEASVASYCRAGHAVAMNSATSALHVACLAIGVAPGDLVWTSAITFVASANCAIYCGAMVDFVDIDPLTYNMSPTALEHKLTEAERTGELPKIIIPVHMCGQSADMGAISKLAARYGIRIIEDASHAIGASYKGEPVGNCRHSDITAFSFHPVKIITTAEGGLATTQDQQLAERMRLLRSHGITRDTAMLKNPMHGPWYYEQQHLGFNYRMTDIQAALGVSQMSRLDEFVARRHELADRYDELLADLPVVTPWRAIECRSSLHLYVIRLMTDEITKTHRQVFEDFRAAGIGVNLHYIPVYLQPFYAALGFRSGLCPEAERYYSEAISLPMFPDLSEAQQDAVVRALSESIGT
jgi:UDP-4-amino-4,6-dideoxy-N-acetyl-beta-L-altrosamine transaminase